MLDELSKKNNIVIGPDVDDWSRQPRQTLSAFMAFIEVGTLNAQKLLMQRTKALQETRLLLEDEKLRLDDIKVEIQETFFMLSSKKDLSEDDVKREIKKYDKPRADVEEYSSRYTELRSATEGQLEGQKRALDNIAKLKERLEQSRDTIFQDHA